MHIYIVAYTNTTTEGKVCYVCVGLGRKIGSELCYSEGKYVHKKAKVNIFARSSIIYFSWCVCVCGGVPPVYPNTIILRSLVLVCSQSLSRLSND